MDAFVTVFDTLPCGHPVQCVTLRSGNTLARVLDYGAILQDFRLAEVAHPLTLGAQRVAAYAGPMRYAGAIVGPVANRIGGACATVAGRSHRLPANDGSNTLHGGDDGLHAAVWRLREAGRDFVSLECWLADGAGGLPGNRTITVTYRVAPGVLDLEITARTDAPTLMNPAPHPYWNLDGTPDIAGHHLRIAAEHYLPTTAARLPTGERRPVDGTPFDLRAGRRLAPPEGFDHNFCLSDAARPLRPVAWLTGLSGLRMAVETTAAGLQVFDGAGFSSAPFAGLGGIAYAPHAGLALEPQFWPDAPNHPAFPSIVLGAGQTFRQHSRFTFAWAGEPGPHDAKA